MKKKTWIIDKYNELSNCSSQKKLMYTQRVIDSYSSAINNKISYLLFCLPYLFSLLFIKSSSGGEISFLQGLLLFINFVLCVTSAVIILSITSRIFVFYVWGISGILLVILLVDSYLHDSILYFSINLSLVTIASIFLIVKIFCGKNKFKFLKGEDFYISIYHDILISSDNSQNKECFDKLLERANELYTVDKTSKIILIVSLNLWFLVFILYLLQKIQCV
ncbi:hypothetical protein SAMN02745213_01513 [Succinivibrio dextrinosolvens DSM 3072]|uniref:Uncharacterized protein n=1 Tax=Succinivibrio dextrinosolvens DSM 3072 TaxID=1123324 RepID=A0A1T4VH30_9GAMM|nr:hypothetical protein [Succinivibrio dextrinosolvens]SKA64284.1 hypothetical protein SAMN02745213_01513 [Succinivibrio dextrinosolvens DSM 3072]